MTNDKDYIEMIGIDEDVLFRVLTCDAKGGFYALRPYEIQELQNSIKAIMDDRDHLRAAAPDLLAACDEAVAALMLLPPDCLDDVAGQPSRDELINNIFSAIARARPE